jgi:hypothetical protein
MVAAATAEPEITALIAVFSIQIHVPLVAGARASVMFGNMLELTLEGARPGPLAPMPLQVPPGQAAADEEPVGLEFCE